MNDAITFDAYPTELPQVVTDWLRVDRESRWIEIKMGLQDPEYADDDRTVIDLHPDWEVTVREYVWCGEGAEGHRIDTAVGVGETLHEAALVAWKFIMADH